MERGEGREGKLWGKLVGAPCWDGGRWSVLPYMVFCLKIRNINRSLEKLCDFKMVVK